MGYLFYIPYSRKDVVNYLETHIYIKASLMRSLVNPDVLMVKIYNISGESDFVTFVNFIEEHYITYELYEMKSTHRKDFIRACHVNDRLEYVLSKGRVEIDWSIDKSNAVKALELLDDK